MKKTKLVLFLCFMVLLTACGNTTSSNGSANANKEESSKKETSQETSKETSKKENKPTSGLLTEIGQWKKDENGSTLTLKKINNKETEIDLKPIKMKIKDVKVFEYTDLEAQDELLLSDNNYKKDKYHRIQITYTTENTSDKNIFFTGVDVITTNTKKQIEVSNSNLTSETGVGSFYGKVENEGMVLVPLFVDDVSDLSSITLHLSEVYLDDELELLHDGSKVKFDF
ncbi:hypothetical protein ACTHP2_00530 [Bacillus altitudinis]|uniref:hypothetical protein n=2 Tax=Bacillus altitudinis TaxID=293387 RepID=UPI0010FF94F1|nr:hypothetical protein [Bacillus altitudinis]MCY7631313.1 hypothetical protein [Bacillus altitudinis]MDX2363943.1 hypothetical protein [Bacillus altitudinis]QCU19650.1 hypothetical protein BPGQ101_12470 [Bacillus altitudinis]